MALGFEQAGFDVLAAVDVDPVHLAAHERNFPLCEPVCADIADLSSERLMFSARRGYERRHGCACLSTVDCVFGGPSCQGFSVIGSRQRDDPRNALVLEFARVVTEIQPRWFAMENVPGLVSPAYRPVLERLYATLGQHGYVVAQPWVLNARDYGVPQLRRRVFIVGARAGEDFPVPPDRVQPRVVVSQALDDLPALSRFRSLWQADALDLTSAQLEAMAARQSCYVRALNSNGAEDLADRREWDCTRLSSVGLTLHSPPVVARFRKLKPGERDEVGRLPKLAGDSQSPTLRAGTGRDHGRFTAARPVHHRSMRVITVREAARLQGFPDWFGFHATKWQGFRQVGNAVPPPLASAVAAQIAAVAGLLPARCAAAPLPLGPDSLLRDTLTEAAVRYGLASDKLPKDIRREGHATPREVV
jgi:DNA (cytosine-5)-methyltransferase 1